MTSFVRPGVVTAALLCAALLLALSLAASAAAQPLPDPAVQAEIVKASDVVYVRELARMQKSRTLNTDGAALARVRTSAEPLIRSAPALRAESGQWQWTAHVETRAEPVLYCLPGGKIIVSTGLLERIRPTAGELAALLAHAIAHALDGHDGDEAAARFAKRREAADIDPNRGLLRLGDLLLNLMLAEPQLPEAERAADALALEMMANAGLDPRAALAAWRKVGAQAGAKPPAFPALHPPTPDRLAAMESRMPAMVALFEKVQRESVATTPAPPPQALRPSGGGNAAPKAAPQVR
ncbi:MAG: M48 family metalloprotease [Betaproteobacteria bacterium]